MIKPYLMFNRECEEAFKFYIEAFGGELIAMQKYSEIPSSPDFPVEESDKRPCSLLTIKINRRWSYNGF